MNYYIEVPFGKGRVENTERAEFLGDEVIAVKGLVFLQISGRQFDRITKTFREHGWSHQILGVADAEDAKDEILGTLLMGVHPDFPGLIYKAE